MLRTVPKQNDNTEGRWVLMAAGGPWVQEGTAQHLAAHHSSPAPLPWRFLPLCWLTNSWDMVPGMLGYQLIWVVPVTWCCPPPFQHLETHLFDMTLQEWMKLTLTWLQVRPRERTWCFPPLSFLCHCRHFGYIPYFLCYSLPQIFLDMASLFKLNSIFKGNCISPT